MAYQLFPLLCGLATLSFTACANRHRHLLHWFSGFLLVLVLTNYRVDGIRALMLIDPIQIATVLGLAAFARLHKPSANSAAVVLGGMVAALWINSLTAFAYPRLPVIVVVSLLTSIVFYAAIHRKNFVSVLLLDEALIIVMILSLLVAVVPAALAGWQTAESLQVLGSVAGEVTANGQSQTDPNSAVLMLSLAFLVVGCIYGKWKYR